MKQRLKKGRTTYSGRDIVVHYHDQTIYDAKDLHGNPVRVRSEDWEMIIEECEDKR